MQLDNAKIKFEGIGSRGSGKFRVDGGDVADGTAALCARRCVPRIGYLLDNMTTRNSSRVGENNGIMKGKEKKITRSLSVTMCDATKSNLANLSRLETKIYIQGGP